jgi:hypothetical protein
MPYADKRKARVASRLAKRRNAAARAAATAALFQIPTLEPVEIRSAADVLALVNRELAVIDGAPMRAESHARLTVVLGRLALEAVEVAELEPKLDAIEKALAERKA